MDRTPTATPHYTPARLALAEVSRPTKHPPGRRKTTWIQTVNKDLKELGLQDIHSKETTKLAQDRHQWRKQTSGKCGAASSENTALTVTID